MSYHLSSFKFCFVIALVSIISLISCGEDECTCHNICSIEDLYGTWHQDVDLQFGDDKNIFYSFSDAGVEVSSDEDELINGVVLGAEPWLDTKLPYFQDLECRLLWTTTDPRKVAYPTAWLISNYTGNTLTVTITDPRLDTVFITDLTLQRVD